MGRLLSVLVAAAVVIAMTGSNPQAEENYPNRSIRLVVGFGPGGATDTFARLLAGPLSKELGQTVFVENVAGASGYIGWQRGAAGRPDGFTLVMDEDGTGNPPGFQGNE